MTSVLFLYSHVSSQTTAQSGDVRRSRIAWSSYADLVEDVATLLRDRADEACRRGVGHEQIVFDPGIDLAKTPAQSVELLRGLAKLRTLERPLLLAISRKDFVGALTGRPPRERLAGTLAALGEAVDRGAAVLRVHDVEAAHDYLRVRAALRGESHVSTDLRLDAALLRERGEAPPRG